MPRRAIVDLLASSLGEEKSEAAIHEAASRLGLLGALTLSRSQAGNILEFLGRAPGVVGAAARLAGMRLPAEYAAEHPPSSRSMAPDRPDTARRAAAQREDLVSAADVCALLAPSLGEEQAREVVAKYAAALHLPPEAFPRKDALDLLDAMAVEAGVVGVVARFAKARLLLSCQPDSGS